MRYRSAVFVRAAAYLTNPPAVRLDPKYLEAS